MYLCCRDHKRFDEKRQSETEISRKPQGDHRELELMWFYWIIKAQKCIQPNLKYVFDDR